MPAVDLVIFGATGDLSRRKILPALGALLTREGTKLRVIGAGRSHDTTEQFRGLGKEASGSPALAANAEWGTLDYADPASFAPSKELSSGTRGGSVSLGTPPETVSPIRGGIDDSAMATRGTRS